MKRLLLVLSAIAGLALNIQAITLLVPQNYPTIEAAINAANNGDSIVVAAGIYDYPPPVYDEPNNITVLGNGYTGINRTTIIGSTAHEVEGKFDIRFVEGWEIAGFELMVGKKGINTQGVKGCHFHDLYIHDLDWYYADGVMVNGNGILIERCVLEGCPYAGLEIWYPDQSGHVFRNNTIAHSQGVPGWFGGPGILVRGTVPNLIIENNIILANTGEGVQFTEGAYTGTEFLGYNDVLDNNQGNWVGCTPGPGNISANPLFVGGQGALQYQLQYGSPCINAGNPTSPPDPDSTIADIGCFYYDFGQGTGILSIDLDPLNPPIIIPPQGGNAVFDATLTCDSSGFAICDAWYDVTSPSGYTLSPALLKPGIMMQANQVINRTLTFYLSPLTQPGTYTITGYLGDYPASVVASDSFTFVKSAVGQDGAGYAWGSLTDGETTNTFDLPAGESAIPSGLALNASPNPFNPSTAISYELRAASYVSLRVYDTAGRLVATLVDGWREAGNHALTFDGSALASGIYLAVLEAGGNRIVDRLLLVK